MKIKQTLEVAQKKTGTAKYTVRHEEQNREKQRKLVE